MFKNLLDIKITGSDLPRTISSLASAGIFVCNLKNIDPLTAQITISKTDLSMLNEIIQKTQDKIQIISCHGIYSKLKKPFERSIIFSGLVFLLFLTIWIPKHILFISVEGNEKIRAEYILQQAELSGLHFGKNRSEIRSEKIKNDLISRIPELAWVGVNTEGCSAVIRVREEQDCSEINEETKHSSIVAITDGVVTSCLVTSGELKCRVGDAVKRGQVLISGYQDLGVLVKISRSQGEIYANTNKELKIVSPALARSGTSTCVKTKYSIVVGKKRINLSKCSGISYASCDKIYSERFIVLPGGFVLPISFATERYERSEETRTVVLPDVDKVIDDADSYLIEHTVSGRIIDRDISVQKKTLLYYVAISYDCIEMIGRERVEDLKFDYGENN